MLRIVTKPQLALLTSLHLGGRALALVGFSSASDLDALPETLGRIGGKVVPFGGGTNILASDGELPLTLVHCEISTQPKIVGEQEGSVLVQVSAGMKLSRLLAWCAMHGIGGLEGMAGIPGDVGGAIAGNAGSRGIDIGILLHQVMIFFPETGLKTLEKNQFSSEYRSFSLLERREYFVIIEAVLRLQYTPKKLVCAAIRDNVARKLRVQPVRRWSAGCVFKNPDPGESLLSAGQLLDKAGFRGKRVGGMCFSPVHANFLVNEGNGGAEAALCLVHEAREAVHRLFGIFLHLEVKIWAF